MKQIYYAIQTIVRGKSSSVIKIVSLSLGLFLSIILFARVVFELNYDTFYKDADKLFLVRTAWGNEKGMGKPSPYIIYPTATAIAEHFPEQVVSHTIYFELAPSKVVHGIKKHKGRIILADSLFFPTLGMQLLKGNALELSTPGSIFLSQSFAREVFGSEEPTGKTLVYPFWGEEIPVIVKGVFADVPENTSLPRITGIVSMSTFSLLKTTMNLSWTGGGNYCSLLRLKQKEDAGIINRKINNIIVSKYFPKDHYGQFGVSGIEVSVTSLRGYHLENENVVRMIRILSLLGFALLLTAALNYALISMSSLARRAKAVGVHKCNGAGSGSILGMFLWETVLIVGVSLLLVVFFIFNFREKIEELAQTSLGGLFSVQNLWAPVAVVLFLFAVGGILPGITFSSIPVTQVFRRYTESKRSWKYFLLFFQFGGAAFLVGMMCIVFVQYHHIRSKDLGYDMERIAYVYFPGSETGNTLSNLRNLPYVEQVSAAQTDMMESRSPYVVNDASGNYLFSPRVNWFNKDFFSFIGIRLKAGQLPAAPGQILVNEAFCRKMGWSSDGVGEVVAGHGTVTGIIEGYYFPDVVEMPPFEIRCSNGNASCIHVRLKEPFADNLQRLNADMKQIYPQEEVIFRSYDDSLRNIFQSTRIFRDATLLACIVILAITLMGLVGYTNDEVRRRSKEIAIRKINGAETGNILLLLSQNIICIAAPAVLVGTLLAWNTGKIWQAQFNDIVSIPVALYIGTAAGVLVFILGTVVLKSWRIANENPVNSIKNE